ncbi:MAG: glycosyltransferase [Kiritimatiellaeota bacterium]|nr:glycosyltransferase [Kiritimatiellota bacterium]
MPRISVVMPTWNAEATIETAARSILDQTEPDLELVAVDDGSTDATPELLEEFSRRDPRVRLLRTPHRGIVAALNTGLDAARAPLIARMDADDRALPERLERQAEFLDTHPEIGLAACSVQFGGDAAAGQGFARYVAWNNSLLTCDQIELNRFIESPLVHPSVVFRRELPARFGAYREGNFPEDYELWLRWLDAGVKMAKLPDRLLVWNDSGDRLTRTDARYAARAIFACKARYLARWLERNNPHHPRVVVWGAGRETRKRAEALTEHGVRIIAYVDVDPRKIGNVVTGRPVLSQEDLPARGACFIVSCVGSRGAREDIRERLRRRGWIEGRHMIMAA